MSFHEVVLQTHRTRLIRIRGETHGAEINQVVCSTLRSLEPYIWWAKEKPTIKV